MKNLTSMDNTSNNFMALVKLMHTASVSPEIDLVDFFFNIVLPLGLVQFGGDWRRLEEIEGE